jgi:hypothetical protein
MGWDKNKVDINLKFSIVKLKKLLQQQQDKVKKIKLEIAQYLRTDKYESANIKCEVYLEEIKKSEGFEILEIMCEKVCYSYFFIFFIDSGKIKLSRLCFTNS